MTLWQRIGDSVTTGALAGITVAIIIIALSDVMHAAVPDDATARLNSGTLLAIAGLLVGFGGMIEQLRRVRADVTESNTARAQQHVDNQRAFGRLARRLTHIEVSLGIFPTGDE